MGKIENIERRKGIDIVKGQFLSEEWCDHESLPKFWADGGDGKHVCLVMYQKKYYETRKTHKIVKGPIDVLISGRRNSGDSAGGGGGQ